MYRSITDHSPGSGATASRSVPDNPLTPSGAPQFTKWWSVHGTSGSRTCACRVRGDTANTSTTSSGLKYIKSVKYKPCKKIPDDANSVETEDPGIDEERSEKTQTLASESRSVETQRQ